MKLLIDSSPKHIAALTAKYDFIGGQLMTPLTRYRDAGTMYGIDNGAFSRFDSAGFARLIKRQMPHKHRCLFAALPDVVGSARRTLEIYREFSEQCIGWQRALVAQDGLEDLDIPWGSLEAVFIGGSTEWKESKAAADVIKTAQIFGRHIHVGRINQPERWARFAELGADTCDGSGFSKFSDDKLSQLAAMLKRGNARPLFDDLEGGDSLGGMATGLPVDAAGD